MIAGRLALHQFNLSYEEVIKLIFEKSKLSTKDGILDFSRVLHDVDFLPVHPAGLTFQQRFNLLRCLDKSVFPFSQPETDWLLKSCEPPFENLSELLTVLQLQFIGDDENRPWFEIIAAPLIRIDPISSVSHDTANPCLVMPSVLDKDLAQLGFRVLLDNAVIQRGTIPGSSLTWRHDGDLLFGSTSFNIPAGAIVQCYANLDNVTYHEFWIVDASNLPNKRRVMLEASDPGLNLLNSLLAPSRKNFQSRDFETGVALLFWLLGFSTSQPGGASLTSDGPDVLATTVSNKVLVIECTIGHLNANSKLTKLLKRTTDIRANTYPWASANDILPVIVTALRRDQVKTEVDEAKKLGVIVVTQEDLQDALPRTMLFPDSHLIFQNAQNELKIT